MSVELIQEMEEFLPERNATPLKGKLEAIVTKASSLCVNNEEAFRTITSLYAESKDWEKKIEAARKEANAPDQDRINLRNDKAKEILKPLKQIQDIAKQKSSQYQTMLEEGKRQEEKRIQEAVELLGLDDAPYIAPLEKTQRGAGAVAYTRLVTKFKLVDLSKVPLKYLRLDEDAIEQDLKLGVAEIAGLEVYQEKTTQLRSR